MGFEEKEIKINQRKMVLVHSKKLNQTMIVYVDIGSSKVKMPLTGMKVDIANIDFIRSKIGGEKNIEKLITFIEQDFDSKEKFYISATINNHQVDYALSVEESNGELKLVILPTLSMERETENKTEDHRDKICNYNYNTYGKTEKTSNQKQSEKEIEILSKNKNEKKQQERQLDMYERQ